MWPYAHGTNCGFALEPIHPNVPKASLEDPKFHTLLAMADALRLGEARERNVTIEGLEKRLK